MRERVVHLRRAPALPFFLFALLAAGCARTSTRQDKWPGTSIALADSTLARAAELGAAEVARKDYEDARQLLRGARDADAAGRARKARKRAREAYRLSQQVLQETRVRGVTTVQLNIDPSGGAIHYSYNSYGDANHLHLVFDHSPRIAGVEARGPVVSAETQGNTVVLVLGKQTYVDEIRREGDTVEILAVKQSVFWPVFVAVFADSGVAYRMNRGDAFQLIDVLRFFPYISYVPRILDGIKVGRGDVGIRFENPKTGFRKTGNLGMAQSQLTVRCRYLD